MTRKRIIVFAGISVLSGIIAYLFLFGKLFAYSPIITGFEKQELTYTTLYIQKGSKSYDYGKIDSLIPSIESFHDLKYLRKPKMFLFSDSTSYIRHSLSKARFCAFYNGRIFASSWALQEAKEGKISLEIYLTHELSHSLLHQHSGLINAQRYPKWLIEGIAMYSADQMGTSIYPDKNETYQLIQNGNFMPPDCFKNKKEDDIELEMEARIPFMYSEFACIVDHLIAEYGKDKFLVYMKSFLKKNDHDEMFKRIYGLEFDQYTIDFKEDVKMQVLM